MAGVYPTALTDKNMAGRNPCNWRNCSKVLQYRKH